MTDDDIILMYRKGYSVKKIVDVYSRFYNADKNRIYQFGKSAEKIVDKARDKNQESSIEERNIFSDKNSVENELFKEMQML